MEWMVHLNVCQSLNIKSVLDIQFYFRRRMTCYNWIDFIKRNILLSTHFVLNGVLLTSFVRILNDEFSLIEQKAITYLYDINHETEIILIYRGCKSLRRVCKSEDYFWTIKVSVNKKVKIEFINNIITYSESVGISHSDRIYLPKARISASALLYWLAKLELLLHHTNVLLCQGMYGDFAVERASHLLSTTTTNTGSRCRFECYFLRLIILLSTTSKRLD